MDDLGRFISTVGFPVAVATFLLIRMNGKVDRLVDAINKLTDHLRHLEDTRERPK